MASLSTLLNPTSTPGSPGAQIMETDSDVLAPELFQSEDIPPIESLEIKNEELVKVSETRSLEQQTSLDEIPVACDHIHDAKTSTPSGMPAPTSRPKKTEKLKDTKHTSKNEGQHTDRRYICYFCNKLFTRRRSVRDHVSKIHNTKTWEPTRSLEIIVNPETGEPTPSLDEQIAAGGAAAFEAPQDGNQASSEQPEPEPEAEREKNSEPPPIKVEQSTEVPAETVEPAVPAPIIGKKRPLHSTKKGTAKVKTSTPNKRPKLSESEVSTPFRSPSVASVQRGPTSKLSRATQSPVSSRAASIDLYESPSSSADTPGSTNDDGEVFCICRKGDNHTWMIACDGPCEEWYHGNCVNIKERDGDLIDKYICPRCIREGYHTTWKRMCRRKGCRKPAKVFEDPPSKYCSRECGRMFFIELIKKGDDAAHVTRNGQYVVEMEKPHKRKKKRRQEETKKKSRGNITPMIDDSRPQTPAYSDDDDAGYETDSSLDDDMLPNRGGALRAGEVKALLEKCTTIDEWRELGRKPVTPPREPDAMELDIKMDFDNFDEFETGKLLSIGSEKANLTERDNLLSAREKFLEMVKVRSAVITEEVRKANPKQKELCGYDPRLTWSEDEFVQWYKTGGQNIVESGKLTPPDTTRTTDGDHNMINGVVVNGTSSEEDADADDNDDDGRQILPTKDGVCVKNRCARHGSNNRWQKSQLAELRFEQDLVRKSLTKLENQEREIRERAVVRAWERRGH